MYKCFQIFWKRTFGIDVDIQHSFAAEKNKEHLRFLLLQHQDLKVLLDDIAHCSRGRALNLRTLVAEPVPPADLVSAGVSCKRKSNLNRNRAMNKACIQQGSEATGITFTVVGETDEVGAEGRRHGHQR